MVNENWNQSVGCVVLKENEVLLVRHTYGSAKGKLLIPGGYCQIGEMPQDAAMRELMEETKITATVGDLIAVRFNTETWYAVFMMKYVSGVPTSDNNENSEVLFINIYDAITHPQITDMTKRVLLMVKNKNYGLSFFEDYTERKGKDFALYGIK